MSICLSPARQRPGSAGTAVTIAQETQYPWSGAVKITVDPAAAVQFALHVRIPGWAQGTPVPSLLYHYIGADHTAPTLTVNGATVEIQLVKGYASIDRTWQPGDVVELTLPMPVQRVETDAAVVENRGKVAIERGPLVYCLEAVDNDGKALGRTLPDSATFAVEWQPDLLHGVNVVYAQRRQRHADVCSLLCLGPPWRRRNGRLALQVTEGITFRPHVHRLRLSARAHEPRDPPIYGPAPLA